MTFSRWGLTIKGSFSQSHDVVRALSYLEGGKLKVDEVVTDVFNLADYGEALETVRARQGIKVCHPLVIALPQCLFFIRRGETMMMMMRVFAEQTRNRRRADD